MGKLEAAYRNELVIIGVESPKYPAEGVSQNVRDAAARLHVEHPVVVDAEHRVWDSYGVSAWPTLMFISPGGEVIGRHAGEAPFEALSRVMTEIIAEYDREGLLSREPIPLHVQDGERGPDELSYPGKVLATQGRLFVSDSGHNRVLIADLEGNVESVIGSGEACLRDGPAAEAAFHRPQGMALLGDTLYVADAANHAVRAVDLSTGRVTTVAGTGDQAFRAVRSGPALQVPLSSPWDLAVMRGSLYIAMAGRHQIWELNLSAGEVTVWAGTGHEAIRDGDRLEAWFAQPMGLQIDGDTMYVSCAESQAVRTIDMRGGQVGTLAGTGLFDFGDADGPTGRALLQHNQAVAARDGVVYVADTYNNKLKVVQAGEVRTVAGSGQAGVLDGPGANARLDEPDGLSLLDGSLYIADTNNHLIRYLDLDSGHLHTVPLKL